MFTLLFGMPLSFLGLSTGVVLGLSTPWGVVRYAWVAPKLILLVGVVLVGALVLGPGTDAMRNATGGAEASLIVGSAYDVVALLLTCQLRPGEGLTGRTAAKRTSRLPLAAGGQRRLD